MISAWPAQSLHRQPGMSHLVTRLRYVASGSWPEASRSDGVLALLCMEPDCLQSSRPGHGRTAEDCCASAEAVASQRTQRDPVRVQLSRHGHRGDLGPVAPLCRRTKDGCLVLPARLQVAGGLLPPEGMPAPCKLQVSAAKCAGPQPCMRLEILFAPRDARPAPHARCCCRRRLQGMASCQGRTPQEGEHGSFQKGGREDAAQRSSQAAQLARPAPSCVLSFVQLLLRLLHLPLRQAHGAV